jgi:predicted MPP superfamily phosphohydrolase
MKTYMLVGLVFVCVVACIVYYDSGYPVYDGEKIVGSSDFPFTFVYFGDNQPREGKEQTQVFEHMIALINEEAPTFIIGGGDYVSEGTPENFEAFLSAVSGLDAHLFFVCGNHDDSPHYQQYLGDRVYAVAYANSIFIILDNSRKVLSQDQLEFLETQLKKDFEYKFVFAHIPPFDPEGSEQMVQPGPFMEIIKKHDVDYVFCSHIHSFYETYIGEVPLIISGGAGGPLRGGFHHFIVVEVGKTITYRVVRCDA